VAEIIEQVEIFSVGVWNGKKFTNDDLVEIKNNFLKLSEVQDVPLKLGHNAKQPMTDGQPALGWLDKIWVVGNKLMARFVDVPEIIFEAISKKLYKKVSVELMPDVAYKGDKFNYVLSGVALLGADIPAVNTLSDLKTTFMSLTGSNNHLVFTAINLEDISMAKTVEELQAELAAEKLKFAKVELEGSAKDKEILDMKKADEKRADEEQKAKIIFARKTVVGMLEKGVKDKFITPAQRESFTKILRVEDDVAVVGISVDDVSALIGKDERTSFSQNTAHSESSGGGGSGKIDVKTADALLDKKVLAYMAKHGKENYADALNIVMRAEPALAQAFVFSNGCYTDNGVAYSTGGS